jgi:FkbM family methyltransferase
MGQGNMESLEQGTTYQAYLNAIAVFQAEADRSRINQRITTILAETAWDDPQTPLDWNNSAVIALIEAEQTDDLTVRSMYLEMAIAALSPVAEAHPLCAAHLALIHSLLGDTHQAIQIAFSAFLSALSPLEPQPPIAQQPEQSAPENSPTLPQGLIYFPHSWCCFPSPDQFNLCQILTAPNSNQQAVLFLGAVLCQAQFVFYNPTGLRFLQLASQLFPDSADVNLKLGISSWANRQWEGLLYLHRAQQARPQDSRTLQALYLAYTDLQQPAIATHWLNIAQTLQANQPTAPSSADSSPSTNPPALQSWQWIQTAEQPFTYLPLSASLLTVEASFRSIVTSVLLAEGRWFEREVEFWQDHIQPGMTVLDVGANVGVYTLMAAEQVGESGRVLAIEPFSGCVQCLQETCRVNQWDWVRVCHGAASDRDGTVRLALHGASELNEVLTDDANDLDPNSFETVPCFTLDTLIAQETLTRVDLLKIDAEGHEIQVLKGSDRLLREFAPIILYENIAKGQADNFPVAEFLLTHSYQLFRYQPYVKQLIPVDSIANLQGSLNIIAIPTTSKTHPTSEI